MKAATRKRYCSAEQAVRDGTRFEKGKAGRLYVGWIERAGDDFSIRREVTGPGTGGGGNTSVKLDEEYMAVKASGFRLDQVTVDNGFVVVDYQKIKDYFNSVDFEKGIDWGKNSVAFIRSSVVQSLNSGDLRPSIETGFHSFLRKYVIHTHSVYANILCCAKEGKEIAEKIFSPTGLRVLWLPYINPGFELTLGIKEKTDRYYKEHGEFPDVIFMENHGLIVTGMMCDETVELNNKVNDMIKDYFSIDEPYPKVRIEKIDDSTWRSGTDFVIRYFKENPAGERCFENVVLYPDQLVYLGDGINITQSDGVVYRTSYAGARTIEETLTAFLYVVTQIKRLGLTVQTMRQEGIDFIRNMEGEKYRKKLARG